MKKDPQYSLLNLAAFRAWQERQCAMGALLKQHVGEDLSACRLLEVGSGEGGNLLDLLRWGFEPEHLAGIELLADRHRAARHRLPSSVCLTLGDACEVLQKPEYKSAFDIVWQATVFSSLLDDAVQQRLATAMWHALRPGGAILWYDFTVDNPRNSDVRGVPLHRVRALFPQAVLNAQRITLAPPLARAVMPWPGVAHTFLNALPFLRTHVLAWLAKPPDVTGPNLVSN